MSQKYYIAVAAVIKAELNITRAMKDVTPEYSAGEEAGLIKMANRLADYFASENPRFKRDVFMKACGLS